jgi:hypothetical protein
LDALEAAEVADPMAEGEPANGIAGANENAGDGQNGGAGFNADVPNPDLEEKPNVISLFFKMMFAPVDGIFILLAFFTAYKVGSGQATG